LRLRLNSNCVFTAYFAIFPDPGIPSCRAESLKRPGNAQKTDEPEFGSYQDWWGILPLIMLITLIFGIVIFHFIKTSLQNHNLLIISEIRVICGKYFGFRDINYRCSPTDGM